MIFKKDHLKTRLDDYYLIKDQRIELMKRSPDYPKRLSANMVEAKEEIDAVNRKRSYVIDYQQRQRQENMLYIQLMNQAAQQQSINADFHQGLLRGLIK